jgi:hypothetical protein
MHAALRAFGLISLILGLTIASWTYLGPIIQQQNLISQYVASPDKDAFDRSHRNWHESTNDRDTSDRSASETYGLVVAVVGVGLVLSGKRPTAEAQ